MTRSYCDICEVELTPETPTCSISMKEHSGSKAVKREVGGVCFVPVHPKLDRKMPHTTSRNEICIPCARQIVKYIEGLGPK